MKLIMNRPGSQHPYEFDVTDEIDALWYDAELERLLKNWDERITDEDVLRVMRESKWERADKSETRLPLAAADEDEDTWFDWKEEAAE